jgi:hypothetical protein
MSRPESLRRAFSILFVSGLVLAVGQAACGDAGPDSLFGASGGAPGEVPPGNFVGDATTAEPNDADPDALGKLVVTPASEEVKLVVTNGAVTTNPPVTFTATYSGEKVAAEWLFDRGELGDIDDKGVFRATGNHVGEGTVTARYGAREGTAKVKVTLSASSNGPPAGADPGPGGFGGLGGVGGEPLGPAVGAGIAGRLKADSNPPASPAELGFLYPYDKTVWPRGLLPPLVMWQTTHEADAVYVKLSQGNFSFEGTYSLAQHPAGSDARKRVRLEDMAWRVATGGNQGDDLKLAVKIYSASDDKVYGPITQSWKVAPGILKGTVYYNSYDSLVTTGGGEQTGGIIAIRPRSPDPVLAVPSKQGQCHACHTVSADGSTLWAQDSLPGDDYRDGASYDLTATPVTRTAYQASMPGGNAEHNRKFTWSAPYPDGSFALASSRFAREAYLQTDAKLFGRTDGAEITPTTGLAAAVQSAVTPAFAPDGKKVVFNFWEGAGANGVTAGAGRSLAVFDFTCGAAAGAVSCPANATHAFSNLREIYRDANRWPAWPTFLPDGKAVVFHNTIGGGNCGPGTVNRNSIHNCQLTTWYGATAELWIAKDGATPDARRLDALNGIAGGASYLPTSATHPDDTRVNYMPTVNPVASGGYYWVVFTSRRLYGNVLADHPWDGSAPGFGAHQKKLWVAAIDINAPAGQDPSHPAFYLPGQELQAGNARGFWAVDPCKPNGQSCESGDECCNGFCRKDPDGGALVCMDKPPGVQCVEEFEKCTVDADCCDPKQACINGKCALKEPQVN